MNGRISSFSRAQRPKNGLVRRQSGICTRKLRLQEIYDFNPDAQIVVMLRNPADMLYSQHSQFLYNGNEDHRRLRRSSGRRT